MTRRKATAEEPEVSETEQDETEETPALPEPPAVEDKPAPEPPNPVGPGELATGPASSAPPADLGAQIAAALKTVHDEDSHVKEHERLAEAAKPKPDGPRSLWDRLRWGG